MKTCSKCKIQKTLGDFRKKKRNPDGMHYQCKQCMNEDYAKWLLNNPEKAKQAQKRWKQNNSEKAAELLRNWRKDNPEKHQNNIRTFKERNPNKGAEYYSRRRASLVNAEQGLVPAKIELIKFYGNKCMHPDCDNVNLEIDHIIPLSKGGAHDVSNFQLLCKSHNSSKRNFNSIDYRPFPRWE